MFYNECASTLWLIAATAKASRDISFTQHISVWPGWRHMANEGHGRQSLQRHDRVSLRDPRDQINWHFDDITSVYWTSSEEAVLFLVWYL